MQVCSAYITWQKQFKPYQVPSVLDGVVVIGALTRRPLLHSMYNLKAAQTNVQWYLRHIPPTRRVWHKAFWRWAPGQSRTPDTPNISVGYVGIPLKKGRFKRPAINLTSPRRARAWGGSPRDLSSMSVSPAWRECWAPLVASTDWLSPETRHTRLDLRRWKYGQPKDVLSTGLVKSKRTCNIVLFVYLYKFVHGSY